MRPIAFVAKVCVKYGDRALAFFGGNTISSSYRQNDPQGIIERPRSICMDVKTGCVHVRTLDPLPLDE